MTRLTFEVDAIDGRAEIAYVRGRYAATFQSPDGRADNRGTFLEIRRRQADGSWLMDIDIFNSDLL